MCPSTRVFKSSHWRTGENQIMVSQSLGTSCAWPPESSTRRIWRRFSTRQAPHRQFGEWAWEKRCRARKRGQRGHMGTGGGDARRGDRKRERGKEKGRRCWRQLESVVACCSDPALPAPQSRGSGPSSRFAPSSSSPTNPGGLPPLLHSGALGSSLTCSPLPPCWHPLPQMYHTDKSAPTFPTLSFCSVANAFARLLVHLLVLGSRL